MQLVQTRLRSEPLFSKVLLETPVAASRPRVTRNGMTYYPAQHNLYYKWLQDQLRGYEQLPSVPLWIEAQFLLPQLKTVVRECPRQDIDNLAKMLLDGITKSGLIEDDHLFLEAHFHKRFVNDDEQPSTTVMIGELQNDTVADA